MKTPSASPLVAVGKASAATIILGICVALLPLTPVVILPFLALPLAYVVVTQGLRYGLAVGVISGALVYIVAGAPAAALVFLFASGVGTALGWIILKGWKFEPGLALSICAVLAAVLVWGFIMWLGFGVDMAWLKEMGNAAVEGTAAQYLDAGMDADSVAAVSQQLHAMVEAVPFVTPGLTGMAAILLAACSMGLAYLIFPRLRNKVEVPLSLSGFRMHWSAAYASIAGLALLLFARGDGGLSSVLRYGGINILLVSQTLFFVQGMAVARWFALNRRWGRAAQTALYVGAVLGQALFQVTGLVGLFDTWIDYRKRFALRNSGAGSTGDIHKE